MALVKPKVGSDLEILHNNIVDVIIESNQRAETILSALEIIKMDIVSQMCHKAYHQHTNKAPIKILPKKENGIQKNITTK